MQATDAAAPDWHRLPSWSTAPHLPHDLVHGPNSSRLHLHLYFGPLAAADSNQKAERAKEDVQDDEQDDASAAVTTASADLKWVIQCSEAT